MFKKISWALLMFSMWIRTNREIQRHIIHALVGVALLFLLLGIYATYTAPTLFIHSDMLAGEQGFNIQSIGEIELTPQDRWKLPLQNDLLEVEAWWNKQSALYQILSSSDTVAVKMENNAQITWPLQAPVGYLSTEEAMKRLGLVFIVGLIYLFSAITVFRRNKTTAGFICALFLVSTAVYLISIAPVIHRPLVLEPTLQRFFVMVFFIASAAQVAIVHFALLFPHRRRLLKQSPHLSGILYGSALWLIIMYLLGWITLKSTLPFVVLWLVILFSIFFHSYITEQDSFLRRQISLILIATLLLATFLLVSLSFPWVSAVDQLDKFALFSLILPLSLVLSMDNQRLFREKIESDKAVREEKQRIRNDLHDSVLNDLASILMLSDGAIRFLKNKPEQSISRLEQVKELSTGASRYLRNFLWVIDEEQTNWENIMESLRKMGHSLLRWQNMTFEFEVEKQPENVPLPTTAIKNAIYNVYREAIGNVIKHAQANQMWVSICFDEHKVYISIADDGVGFENGNIERGRYGLTTMNKRVSDIGGHLECYSEPGKGARILVQIPYNIGTSQHRWEYLIIQLTNNVKEILGARAEEFEIITKGHISHTPYDPGVVDPVYNLLIDLAEIYANFRGAEKLCASFFFGENALLVIVNIKNGVYVEGFKEDITLEGLKDRLKEVGGRTFYIEGQGVGTQFLTQFPIGQ